MRGESAQELSGFVRNARGRIGRARPRRKQPVKKQMMERENTGGRQVFAQPQPPYCGIEYHCATDIDKIRLDGTADAGSDPGKGRRLERTCNGSNMNMLGKIGPKTLAVRQRADRENVHGAGGLTQSVSRLDQIAGILRDGLFQAVAAAGRTIAGGHDDDRIEFAGESSSVAAQGPTLPPS